MAEKKKAIRRLKAMYPLRGLVDKMFEKAVEYSHEGRPVAWCMVNWWGGDSLLRAMDIACIYPEDYGAVCAASGVAQKYLERSNIEGFPNHICGYARNTIGYASLMKELDGIPPGAPMSGMPKPRLLVGSGYFCDTRFKWFQALGRYFDAPLWLLEMPHPGVPESLQKGAEDYIIKFMVDELKKFVDFLEHTTQKKMDWDRLDEIINDTIEMNRIWWEVNDLRKAQPCPMHARDFWSCMPAALYQAGDPKETAVLYKNLYDEVKGMIERGEGAVPNEKFRLAFGELPPWHNLAFFDDLAERGWNVVVESWAYHPPQYVDLSRYKDPLERLARHTFQYFSGFFKNAYKAKEELGYFGYPYIEYARNFKCDGFLAHPLLSCRTATNHLMYVQDRLMQKLKIPSLVMEGDIVDHTVFNPAEVLRKADAFEESMLHYREMRKREGMEW